MSPDENRIAQLYAAFNARDFDRCIAMMTPGVIWPDEAEDRLLVGAEDVLDYFTRVTSPLRAQYEPISLFTAPAGEVVVLARQIITSASDGTLWSSTRVRHSFTLERGLVARLESRQNDTDLQFPGVTALIERLHRAINARDVEAVLACYAPDAHFQDRLEGRELEGHAAIRAHFERLFETVRVNLSPLTYALEPDDRVRVRLQVETRSPEGRMWQDGAITVWYRLQTGVIVEQDIDDSGEERA